MRFLCDEMLARLARLLRAAGYDTDLASGGEADDRLLARARTENRVLLTRDRKLAERAHPRSLLVTGRSLDDAAAGVAAALPVDWSLAPFTRCVVDNTPLADAAPAEVATMPPEVRGGAGPFRECPACGRLYWPGSHVKRIRARLSGLSSRGA
jgi:uncharacterized protein